MLVKTTIGVAPWNLIEGNDKYWERVRVLSKLVKILSAELQYGPLDPLKYEDQIKEDQGALMSA